MPLIRLGDIPVPEHGSFSQLTKFMECEVKHRIERSKLIPEPPAWWNIGGTAMHAAIEQWEKLRAEFRDLHGPSTLTGLFEQNFEAGIQKAEQAEDAPARAQWRAAKQGRENEAFWRKMAPNWCRTYAQHAGSWHVAPFEGSVAAEVPFKIALGGVPLKGSIDQVLIHAVTGEVYVQDLKFGASDSSPLQLGIYRRALSLQYGVEVTLGRFWNPRKKDVVAQHNLNRYTPEYLDALFARFDERRRLDPLPTLSRDCSWCPYRQVCPAHPDTEGPFQL